MIQTVKKLNNPITNNFGGYEITTIDGTKISVPLDEDNRHYQAILAWVAEGNTIQEAD
mgnify:CR=1 FL=1|tara:strand:+ start:385 stop:558 length:174 start_codon:yes stop_codon:yes gene_type:complete